MNKAIPVLVLAILLVALIPSAMAQEAQENKTSVKSIVAQKLTALRERVAETGAKALTAARLAKIQVAQIRDYQQEKFQIAIDRCKELNKSEECEEKLQARTSLVGKLKNKSLELLNIMEQKKIQLIGAWQELKKIGSLAKYKVLKAKDYVARIVSDINLTAAREKFLFAQTKFTQAKDKYQLAKEEFGQLKLELEACEGNESAECEEIRLEIRLKARDFLNATLETVLNQLEKVRAKVQESETLTEEEVSDALEKIDAKISSVQELQGLVLGITENTTKEEIQNITAQIRQVWRDDFKPVLEKWAGFVQAARMGGIYVRLKHLETKLNSVLAKMVEKGKNITEAQDLVEQFNAKLEEVKQDYLAAQDKFKEAAGLTGEDRNAAIREAQASMREANAGLKAAHQLLKDIMAVFRAQTAIQDLEENEAEEILEEQEETLAGAEKIKVVTEAGIAEVEVEVGEIEQSFTVESSDLDEIAQETASQTGLDLEKVQELMEVEVKE